MPDGACRLRGKAGQSGMRTYFASRLFGVVFIEYHRARQPAAPFFAHRSCRGEHLLWLGRLHLIYTPASVVFGSA